jgi:DNA-binding NtrC family response regulator
MPLFENERDRVARRVQSAAIRTAGPKYELLAITPDTRFFSSLQFTATPHGWIVRWARSVNEAKGILACRTIPVILYDWYSAAEDWATSIARLKLVPEDPCIVVAQGVDEELWRRALNLRVYDVVSRSGQVGHLVATLKFAWKWKVENPLSAPR